MSDEPVNVICLAKGSERYIWLYTDAQRANTLRSVGNFASRDELSLTWFDAAVLSQTIRQTANRVNTEESR